MSGLTNRERLLAVLEGKPVDRVPIWLLFPYHPTSYYADVRTNPYYRDIFEASKRCAIMLNRRNFNLPVFDGVAFSEATTHQDGAKVVKQTWAFGGRELYSENHQGIDGTRIKKMLSSSDDLETVARFPILTDREKIHRILDEQLPQYLKEKREFPEEYGAMMLGLGEPVGFLYHSSNLEEYAIWSLTHSGLVGQLLDRLMEQRRHVYRYCLERDLADVYFMVGSELASPPLVSRKTFQQWIVPYGKELVDLVHSYGKKVIMHYHGQIKEILPDFVTMGPDGLHVIESPPIGDCTMSEAYATVGDAITLIGNIQYDCFRSDTREEMAIAVKELIDECRGRRFILSPTAGPYEEVLSQRMIDNYLEFMKTGWEYGKH